MGRRKLTNAEKIRKGHNNRPIYFVHVYFIVGSNAYQTLYTYKTYSPDHKKGDLLLVKPFNSTEKFSHTLVSFEEYLPDNICDIDIPVDRLKFVFAKLDKQTQKYFEHLLKNQKEEEKLDRN